MDTAIQMFRFENKQEIRVVQGEDGEPWFVAAGVCKALEYANTSKALSDNVDIEDIVYFNVLPGAVIGGLTHSYTPGMSAAINESGLYSLILRSSKPEAKRFKKWLTSEVLPSIRKTGMYTVKLMTPAEMMVAQAQMMLDHERRLEALENQLKEQLAERQEAEQLMLALPAPSVASPEKSTRADVNIRVRAAAQSRGIPHAFVWSQLYRELRDREHIDVEIRAKNSKRSALDIVEEEGKMEVLYAIACEVLA